MSRGLCAFSIVCSLLLLLCVAPAAGQYGADMATVRVMFDFGDGTVHWQETGLGDNRTAIFATEQAADSLGVSIEVQWFPFGAFVADIGDRDPVWPFWWHFLLWNSTTVEWELSPLGASDVLLEEGDAIGWFLASDDPPLPGPRPLATPENPYPVVAFRGDLANTGSSSSQPPWRPAVRWSFDFDGSEVSGSSVGAQGIVYQVTWNGTHAIDLKTGRLVWKVQEVAGLSTPAIVGEDLVVGSRDGRLYRLRGDSGTVVWSVLLQEGAEFTGIASSPKVNMGRAVVGTFNESGGKGRLVSVNISTGEVVWSVETGSVHMSSPAIHDGAVYVGVMGLFNPAQLTWEEPYGLLSVAEEDGADRWFFATDGPVASSPAVADGVVYFTSRDGHLYAVTVDGSAVFKASIGASTSSPAFKDGRIYAASGVLGTEGRVTAHTTEGELLWEFQPNGPVQSSLTLASGFLLFATNAEEGTVYALSAEDGSVVWTYRPTPVQYILSSPVVVDGIVLIASDNGFLYAIEEEARTVSLTPFIPYIAGGVAAVILVLAVVLQLRRLRE